MRFKKCRMRRWASVRNADLRSIELLQDSASRLKEVDFISTTAKKQTVPLQAAPVQAAVRENRAADVAVVKADEYKAAEIFLWTLRKRSKAQYQSMSVLR